MMLPKYFKRGDIFKILKNITILFEAHADLLLSNRAPLGWGGRECNIKHCLPSEKQEHLKIYFTSADLPALKRAVKAGNRRAIYSRTRGGATVQYANVTIAADFDGTICADKFPEIGEPNAFVIDVLKRMAAQGAKIILHTCRENGTRRPLLDEAVAFCAAHGITLYAVNENPDAVKKHGGMFGVADKRRKVYADIYLDDRAISPKTLETWAMRGGGDFESD